MPATEGIADLQGPPLDKDRGHDASAMINLRFDDFSFGVAVIVGPKVEHLGLQKNSIEEIVDADFLQRRDLHVQRLAAPLFRTEINTRKAAA